MDDFEARLLPARRVVENYVRFRLSDSPDWEDAAQEVFTLAYLKYGQLKEKDAFMAWILTIARNHCAEYYRSRSRRQEVALEELPETPMTHIQPPSAVEETLEKLRQEDQELLRLTYWEELPQSRIAQRLGIPVGTVKSRLHKAKQRFKAEYPYHPKPKGEYIMDIFPEIMPQYTIEKLDTEPFSCKWEELQGWLLIPKLGEKIRWAMYDFPERKITSWTDMAVVGRAEVHGIEGVEITATQYGTGDDRDPGFVDSMERRFVAQLTDTHSRYLAESHVEDGVRKCHTFLDGDSFLNNWGFGPDNIGNETNLRRKRLIIREGKTVTAPAVGETLDVVDRCAVTINGKRHDTVCVMDIELYNEAVVSEQYIDRSGRTVLWRRFNRDDWAVESFGGDLWSRRLPENERLIVNGETYVHWYDCISDYIF